MNNVSASEYDYVILTNTSVYWCRTVTAVQSLSQCVVMLPYLVTGVGNIRDTNRFFAV